MCWVQDNCYTETDTMYCLGCWFQTDTRQTDICLEPNREKEAPGHHFHSLFPLQKCKIQFIQTKVSV